MDNLAKKITLLRKTFKFLETYFPVVAKRLGKQLFFTPIKYKLHPREQATAKKARKFQFKSNGQQIQAYEWGEGDKVVLIQHGWSSRALQLYAFIDGFVEAGYKVVGLDGPAHGQSSGIQTDLLQMSKAQTILAKRYNNLHAIVSHSIGGAVSAYSILKGLKVQRLITISTPGSNNWILDDFVGMVGASKIVSDYVRNYIARKYSVDFESVSAAQVMQRFDMQPEQILMVHDEHDKQVSWRHFELMQQLNPKTNQLVTQKLGHNKILRNSMVVKKVIEFANQNIVH